MKRKSAIILILLLAVSANGATYYITKSGHDTDAGTSWATAWENAQMINSISGGDTVLFGSGDWYGVSITPPSGNSATDKTVIACSTYTLASAGLTTLWGGDLVTGWTDTSVGGNTIYKAAWTPSADSQVVAYEDFPCVVGGDSLYLPRNGVANVTQAGYYAYNYTDDMLYIWPYIGGDPDTSGHVMKATQQRLVWLNTVNPPANDIKHIEIFGLHLKMGKGGVIWFSEYANRSPDSCYFLHCTIAHATNGGWAPTGANSAIIYKGATTSADEADLSVDNVFRACSIYSVNSDIQFEGTTHAGAACCFYSMKRTVFDSCYIEQSAGAGVMWKGGCCSYSGNRISFCTFDGVNSMPYGGGVFTEGCIEHACGAEDDSVYGNIFKNITGSTAKGWYMGNVDCIAATVYGGGDFICNNTFYNCNRFWQGGVVVSDTASFSNITFKYNIMYKVTGSSYYIVEHPDYPYWQHNTWFDIDSNYFYDPTYAFTYRYSGVNHNWAYWTDTLSLDLNGFNSDPALTNPSNGDFSCPDCATINVTYGGRTWNTVGAVQNDEGSASPSLAPFLK